MFTITKICYATYSAIIHQYAINVMIIDQIGIYEMNKCKHSIELKKYIKFTIFHWYIVDCYAPRLVGSYVSDICQPPI